MSDSDAVKRLQLGAAAGFAGTFALQILRTAGSKLMPDAAPPMRQEPGEYMVEKAEEVLPPQTRAHVPETAEKIAAQALGVGYGLTFGALYAATRPDSETVLADGAALGLGVWAVGYLGWLPGLKIMPPLWEQNGKQISAPIVQHALYGVVTVAAYRWLRSLES